ncbi:AsmA family protein [Rhodoferax mekongensis]|uniref:AsmA family protein n=1 Tax=Rhodoferax mekongensis TaxID=3068341 RepID=UPI0028BDA75A|nr:AsmA family protein [Rhodoferax sp. TBRC 17199]MDT7514567.1 AsmA family protein [Rhodoferax sp. TBRC 17199]
MKALRIVGWVVLTVVGLLAVAVGALFALFDGDKIKAEISRTVLEQKQRTLVIAGKPQLSVWPDVGIQLDGVTLSERGSSTEFAALKSARMSVAVMPLLSKQVQVRALDVTGLKATLIKRKDGSLNIADLLGDASDQPAPADAPAQPAEPLKIDVAATRIADAQLTWRDEQAGSTTNINNLSLSTGHVQADTGAKTANIEKLSLAIKGHAGADGFSLALDAPKLALSPARSSGEAVTLSAGVQGSGRSALLKLVLSGVEGNADALRISKLTGSLDLAHPDMPMKQLSLPLNGSLQVNLAQQSAALALATKFDESNIATKLNVARFAPLSLGFDLDIDQLNVDKYLPPKPAGEAPAKEAAGKEAPINLAALKGPTVQGNIRIGSLQVAKLKLAQINAKLALAGGKLDVAPLSMKLYEGSTSGSVSVNASGNQMALRQNLQGVSINPLMKDLLDKDMLEGRGNITLDVNTRGETVSAFKKALDGSAALALKDGAIKGINLAQSLRDVKAKLGQADSTQAANASQKTDFSELTASFKIANGVARNDDLSMKSPFIRLGGAGDIDVGAGQMNYLAKATVVASGEGQGGKDANQLKGLTVPVRLSGPFEALSYKIEFGAMLEDATKAKVEEKKQEIKTKVEDAVKDKAKDLFKGLLGK